MFDVGFQEIVLIGIIALLVIGPERLPSVARSVGLWVGKIQRFVAGVKTDISKELQTDELRGLLNSQEDQIRELKETLTETRNEFARTASAASSSLTDGMSSAVEQVRSAADTVKGADQALGDASQQRSSSKQKTKPAVDADEADVNSAINSETSPATTSAVESVHDTDVKPAGDSDSSKPD